LWDWDTREHGPYHPAVVLQTVTSPFGSMGHGIIVQNYDAFEQQFGPFVIQAYCNLSCVPL
jgi:hypothetical protein